MHRIIIVYCLITSLVCYADDDSWIKQAANRTDPEAIEWLKQHLVEHPLQKNILSKQDIQNKTLKKECFGCSSDSQGIFSDSHVFVFMSFSIPDDTWVSLSKELEKIGGVFVIRGLPKHSFTELASKILSLKEKGVTVPIQIDPKKFQVYQLASVPAFVIIEEKSYDKVVGNVSVKFALDLMATKGVTSAAKLLNRTYGMKS